jgi:hypothetical protein
VAQLTNRSPLSFEAQTKKPLEWFWGPNHYTVSAGFEAQTGKPVAIGFEAKPEETIDHGFEASRSSGHRVPDLYLTNPDPLHQVLYSFNDSRTLPAMPYLSLAHQEIRKRDSAHKIDRGRTTKNSQIRIQTKASQ